MLLSELLNKADLPATITGGDAEIGDVQFDSRRCTRGSCFVAVKGWKDDGHAYIDSALAAGASAVVCEHAPGCDIGVSRAIVGDTHEALGRLGQAMRDFPAAKLKCIGITGTNGKTTAAHMIRAILREAGYDPGLLGTVCYQSGQRDAPAETTTPDPIRLSELTAEMVEAGKTHLVMEVSSHALDQKRTAGIAFDVAVYTNLSGDHLDYHGTMAEYLGAKLRLFQSLDSQGSAVLNRDDPYAERFAESTNAAVTWYALSGAAGDLRGKIRRIGPTGSRFVLSTDTQEIEIATAMIGRHNVQNCLAAAGAGLAAGVDLETIASGLAGLDYVPGRLQAVKVEAPYQVLVDYAHTDDALRNVLSSLKPIIAGRIIVVFGCGGDRDRTKRPRMAKVAEELADRMVITSDNPRSESPEFIIEQIVAGLSSAGRAKAEIEPDRYAAIQIAVSRAEGGDVVLIAGKGHETCQLVGDKRLDFDDTKVAEEIVRAREVIR